MKNRFTGHFPENSPLQYVHLIGSLGMFLVLGQLIAIIWGNDTQILRSGTDKVYLIPDGLRLAQAQCVGRIGGLFTLMSFFVWLHRSSLGLQFRAMADNQVLLSLMGRNVRQLRRLVFLISGMIAAIAALVSAYDVGFDPNVGLNAVLIVFRKWFFAPDKALVAQLEYLPVTSSVKWVLGWRCGCKLGPF